MPSTRRRRPFAIVAACAAMTCSRPAPADEGPPTALISRPDAPSRLLASSRTRPAGSSTDPGSGWWMGGAGIAAALAALGGLSLASRRFLPSRDTGPIRVVGRSALSTKHTVYLLRVGDRVLILGAGPQGPPSTLGEVTDPDELARLSPRRAQVARASTSTSTSAAPARTSTGFDRRIGDDE